MSINDQVARELNKPQADCKQACLKSLHGLGFEVSAYSQVENAIIFQLITHALSLCKAQYDVIDCMQAGSTAMIFAAQSRTSDRHQIIAKVQLLSTPQHITEFEKEIKTHEIIFRKIQAAQHVHAPKLRHHYRFVMGDKDFIKLVRPNYKTRQLGVVLMDKVSGILNDIIKQRYRDHNFMVSVGIALKTLLKELASRRIVHGDLHTGNIGYTLHGTGIRLHLIDFGRSAVDVSDSRWQNVCDFDCFFIWRISLFPGDHNRALNIVLRSDDVAFPGSTLMQRYFKTPTPQYTTKTKDMSPASHVVQQTDVIRKLDAAIFVKLISPFL